MEDSESLVELIRTTDSAQLMVIKSVLDSAEIPYSVQGEDNLRMISWGLSGTMFQPSAFSAILYVRPEDLEDAQAVIQPLE